MIHINRNISLFLAFIFFGVNYAAPHHFSQCEIFNMPFFIKGKIFASGENFQLTSNPIESLETDDVDMQFNMVYITESVQEKHDLGYIISAFLKNELFKAMDDGLKRYLSYKGIFHDERALILDTEEINEKTAQLAHNMTEAVFDVIFNAPEDCHLATHLKNQGFDLEELYACDAIFSLNACPMNTLGDTIEELKFFSSLSIKHSEF